MACTGLRGAGKGESDSRREGCKTLVRKFTVQTLICYVFTSSLLYSSLTVSWKHSVDAQCLD